MTCYDVYMDTQSSQSDVDTVYKNININNYMYFIVTSYFKNQLLLIDGEKNKVMKISIVIVCKLYICGSIKYKQ